MKLLIKNARVIDITQDFIGDIYIEDGTIEKISREIIAKENIETFDCKGKILMPAFIDTHSHFRDPGFTWKEDLETGSRAALRGGYTGVCLMANTNPICSSKEVLDYVRNKSKELDLIDIHQCISVTKNFDGKTLSHLEELKDDNGVKAISDDGVGVSNSKIMMDAMKIAKENNWVLMSHAESSEFSKVDMRIAENIMTLRDIELARITGAHLHMCHVSTMEALECIINAKRKGVNVTLEVTPHHIALINDISDYRVNPPIRQKEDVEAILSAIKMGMIDTIGTDHAPHTLEEKTKGSPGMVGIETAFSICYSKLVKDNIISLNDLSKLMSFNPAKLLGMNKGKISIGVDADLVLVDIDKKIKIDSKKFASKGRNTPFEGMEYYGEILATVKGGRILYNAFEEK